MRGIVWRCEGDGVEVVWGRYEGGTHSLKHSLQILLPILHLPSDG